MSPTTATHHSQGRNRSNPNSSRHDNTPRVNERGLSQHGIVTRRSGLQACGTLALPCEDACINHGVGAMTPFATETVQVKKKKLTGNNYMRSKFRQTQLVRKTSAYNAPRWRRKVSASMTYSRARSAFRMHAESTQWHGGGRIDMTTHSRPPSNGSISSVESVDISSTSFDGSEPRINPRTARPTTALAMRASS